MEWIFIIAIGFICIAYPIILPLYLQWLPWYVTVAYFIWVVGCIGSIAFSKGKDKKWYERMIPAFILTFCFTVLHTASIDTDHYMFDDGIGIWYAAPTLSLPLYYFIGRWLNGKLEAKREADRKEYNANIERQIAAKKSEIQKLEQSVKDRAVIMHFVEMLHFCGEDITVFSNEPSISDISKLMSNIKSNEEDIQHLNAKKR